MTALLVVLALLFGHAPTPSQHQRAACMSTHPVSQWRSVCHVPAVPLPKSPRPVEY